MNTGHIKMTPIRDRWNTPVLAPVMQNRWLIALLGTIMVLQVVFTALELSAWPCPVKSALGVNCPGCGLTRAVVLVVQGNWTAAVHLHAFAPLAVAIGILLTTGSLLPTKIRHHVINRLAAFEKHSGIATWLILSALIYWAFRLTS
jgi:hypothetical protein